MEKSKPKKRNSAYLILCGMTLMLSCNKIREQNYFLPKNFEGNVVVIYSQKDSGQKDIYNFYIPHDGILRSEYAYYSGDYKINFYAQTDSDRYDTLFEQLPGFSYETTKNRIYFNRLLTYSKPGNPNAYHVTTFYVGKRADSLINKERFSVENKIEQMVFENK